MFFFMISYSASPRTQSWKKHVITYIYYIKDFYECKLNDEQTMDDNFNNVAYNKHVERKSVELDISNTSHKWKKGTVL